MDIVPTALGHCGGFFESAALTSTEVVRQRCVTAGGANGRDMCSHFLYFSQLVRIAPAPLSFSCPVISLPRPFWTRGIGIDEEKRIGFC